jgi:hypothetical protein
MFMGLQNVKKMKKIIDFKMCTKFFLAGMTAQ